MLGLVVFVGAEFLTFAKHHGVVVQDVDEMAAEGRGCHRTDGVADFTREGIVLPLRTEHVRRTVLVVEAQCAWLVVHQIGRIHVELSECLIGRDEECIVGTHGEQISIEVLVQSYGGVSVISILDSGVHNSHVVGEQSRCRHSDVTVRRKHSVQHVGHTVVGNLHIVGAIGILVQHVERQAHRVGGIVHHITELAGHGSHERRLHQVVEECLHNVLRNRVDVLGKILFGVLLLTILVDDERTTAARQEVGLHGLVGRNEDGSKVAQGIRT